MSNIYIQEPPTQGKVLLQTTVGDIDIELWSKETPKACRNFVQLCLEGYYNKTIFHRVVKGFIVQGGDPKGDGTGGDSIYGQPFKDEFHTRLRFVRRGLVAMANSGKDDNASQFFFTLGPATELQNKNTIFGKVTGNTLYNMLKLEESLVDQNDRPIYPHKIILCKVLSNPFPDIVPRALISIQEPVTEKPKEKLKKNFKLLSFGEEAEEDEAEADAANEVYKGQSKSSHDLTHDPLLSSVPAVVVESEEKAADAEMLESIRKKLKKSKPENEVAEVSDGFPSAEKPEVDDKRKEIRKQIRELKKQIQKSKKEKETNEQVTQESENNEPMAEPENEMLAQYHKQLAFYEKKKSDSVCKKGTSEREQQTLKFLEKFQNNLEKAKEKPHDDKAAEEDDESWLAHSLRAEEEVIVLAKDANLPATDRYDISDPRNPMNERRRKEHKRKRSHRTKDEL